MTEAQTRKGSMQSDGTRDELLPLRPTRQCICCQKFYDRADEKAYRPLGVFENYCLCEECLYKDKHGWG
jgi:hypothetical protein